MTRKSVPAAAQRLLRWFATVPAEVRSAGWLALTLTAAAAEPRAVQTTPVLRDLPPYAAAPRPFDHTLLSWRDGAPYVTNARPEDAAASGYSSDRRVLRLETGWYSADIDTEQITISGFARHEGPRDEGGAERSALSAARLPDARLHLAVVLGDVVYVCAGRRPVALDRRGNPAAPLEFPVRVIESGRFFQKVALHDLEFRDGDGRRLPADAHVEIAAWSDRLAVTLVVKPEAALAVARAEVRLETAGGVVAGLRETPGDWNVHAPHRATLTLDDQATAVAPGPPVGVTIVASPNDERGRTTRAWNSEEMCHEVTLHAPPWPGADGYPAAMLDEFESYGVVVENASDHVQPVALKFVHTAYGGLTGCVPMILDAGGTPAGIAVQVSKNWHLPRDSQPLPYAGRWLHGRTRLVVPPRGRIRFQYGTAFAHWGGVPSASLAQLSLVGWGHNGFWDELALGSFGESICFQPLRVQRRSLFTDIRPLHQLGMARGSPYAWTSNVGGLDTFVRHDAEGRYVPFKRNVARYVSHGPNLAELHYAEVSQDEAVEGRVELYLPRTDDLLRVFMRVRHDVRREMRFSRLAFFQLGADFYNSCEATRVAFGSEANLVAEHVPDPGLARLPRWDAAGAHPWVSLHGQARDDLARTGQATRGLIVREWRARLGGRNVPAPSFAAARGFAPGRPLGVDIVAPAGLDALLPGDFVDMWLELVILPVAAERYYGPDEPLRSALAAGANTWRPVAREAAGNRPTLTLTDGREIREFPLTLRVADTRETAFTLRGGLGWIPVRFTGLSAPDAVELHVDRSSGSERVAQGPRGRAFWQADSRTDGWAVTYNLPAAGEGERYIIRLNSSGAARVIQPTAEAIP